MLSKDLEGFNIMIFGDKKIFAIECELTDRIDDWVYGYIVFWFCGQPVGDWDDSTDLKGCLSWLKNFASEARNRFEPELEWADKDTAFEWLYESVMHKNGENPINTPKFEDVFSRFHIAHLGMSSFDRFDLILIEQPHSKQRCLWRHESNNEVHECYIPEGEMQKIAKLCQTWLEKQI